MKQEENQQSEFNEDDAVEYIYEHLPKALKFKIDEDIIYQCLDLLEEFGRQKGIFLNNDDEVDIVFSHPKHSVTVNEDVMGELLPELLPGIDHDELVDFAKRKLVEEDIYLSAEELHLIYELELDYEVHIGDAEEEDGNFRLTREN